MNVHVGFSIPWIIWTANIPMNGHLGSHVCVGLVLSPCIKSRLTKTGLPRLLSGSYVEETHIPVASFASYSGYWRFPTAFSTIVEHLTVNSWSWSLGLEGAHSCLFTMCTLIRHVKGWANTVMRGKHRCFLYNCVKSIIKRFEILIENIFLKLDLRYSKFRYSF